jgi:ubiquinone/menaquinone biosynthesis C-methylase UbiE
MATTVEPRKRGPRKRIRDQDPVRTPAGDGHILHASRHLAREEEDHMSTAQETTLERRRAFEPGTCHPVRNRLNAWLFRFLDGYQHRRLGGVKREAFGGLPPTILEIGAGTGANLRYLRAGTRVIAIEPNPRMHPYLRAAARRWGIHLDLREGTAERLPLPDASVCAVVSSLVLCSVGDPAAVLREIQRVLRPGGRFWCVEHVRAPDGTALAALQRILARPWRWFFEGCECRDVAGLLGAAGFASVEVEPFTIRTIFLPVRTAISAVAVR